MSCGAFCAVIDHVASYIRWSIAPFTSGVYNTMAAALKENQNGGYSLRAL
jgi:hypothetical protein